MRNLRTAGPPTGRLGRSGSELFAASIDCVGPSPRSTSDPAAAYDLLQGPDGDDAAWAGMRAQPVTAVLDQGVGDLRIAIAGGHFGRSGTPEVFDAVASVARALGVTRRVEIADAAVARAAAMIMTAAEGAELHMADLRTRGSEFDPNTRHLFLAGAMVPAAWYARAQRFRRQYCEAMALLFAEVDVILAPATPYPAFPIGQAMVRIGEVDYPAAGHLGVYTQPFGFAGLPVIAAPVANAGALPLGIQIVAAPWREDHAFRVAQGRGENPGAVALHPLGIN